MQSQTHFTIIYSFKIVDGKEIEFIHCWTELTKLIYQFEGSFGSKLFKANNKLFIATAQWPDRETYDQSGNNLPEQAIDLRKKMRECCSEVKQEFELKSVVNDLLKDEQHGSFKNDNFRS